MSVMELNGRAVDLGELRALGLYNYGHFTSMRVEEGMRVRGLTLHMERLARDSSRLFGAEIDAVRVRDLIRSAVEQVEPPCVVRVTVFDSSGGFERPGNTTEPDILISTRSAPLAADISPLRVESVQYQRDIPEVKHIGLFGSLFHRRAAQLKGFDDALFVDDHSRVLEGATWNVGFFDGAQVLWPKADMLAGVTVNLLKSAMASSGMPCADSVIHVSQVSETWTAFATNSSVGVRPIQSIDSVELLDSSPVIRSLQLHYAAITGESL